MKKYLIIAAASFIFVGCKADKQNDTEGQQGVDSVQVSKETSLSVKDLSVSKADASEALAFINEYVAAQDKFEGIDKIGVWVAASPHVTENYREAVLAEIKSMKKDSEGAVEADIIFGTQDYPDEGFELEMLEVTTGRLLVRGRKWRDFRLAMKVANVNGKWLVNGCGPIMAPDYD